MSKENDIDHAKIMKVIQDTLSLYGYTDIFILWGAIDEYDNINTFSQYPGDTTKDFDIRLTLFAMLNHVFTDYNNIKKKLKPHDSE